MNPHLRDVKEFTQTLGSPTYNVEFSTDVESPYPKPEIEKIYKKPEAMNYPGNKIRFSYYGNTIPSMIETAIKIDDEKKEILTGMIANQMKKAYILFNESSVDNNVIRLHLKQLSNGQLTLPDDFEFIQSTSVRQSAGNRKHNGKRKTSKEKNTNINDNI